HAHGPLSRRGLRIRRRRLLKHHADDLALGRLRNPREERHRALADRELARLLDLRPLRVPEVVQAIDELPFSHRLTAAQLERTREDSRKYALALAVEMGVEQAREADVVVAGREEEQDGRDGERRRSQPYPAMPPGACDPDFQPQQVWFIS